MRNEKPGIRREGGGRRRGAAGPIRDARYETSGAPPSRRRTGARGWKTTTIRVPMVDSTEIVTVDVELDVNGVRLATRSMAPDSGAETSVTLVFLHEGLGSMETWRRLPEELVRATGLPALLYDRRGYGRSDPLDEPWGRDYLHRYALDELPGVLGACNVQRPLLVGHSDGGTIALLYAARFPTVGVVAEAAHVFVEEAARAGIRRTIEAWRGGDLKPRLERIHGDKTAQIFRSWSDTWLAPWFDSWNVEHELAAIDCPVLLLQGDRDEYATPQHLEIIARGVGAPSRGVLLEGCGHAPHLQSRRPVFNEILGFIAGLGEAKTGRMERWRSRSPH